MAIETKLELVDAEWSIAGDFVTRNGDMADTLNSKGRAFIQEVEDRIKSSIDDWKLLPDKGSNLDEFQGAVNNERTWRQIEGAMTFSLTKDAFLDSQDFVATVAPVSNTEVAGRIDFNTALTNVEVDSRISVKVIFDLQGRGPFLVR